MFITNKMISFFLIVIKQKGLIESVGFCNSIMTFSSQSFMQMKLSRLSKLFRLE